MAHFQQRRFAEEVRSQFPSYFTRAKVLEVGSRDVTGTVRDLFDHCDYLGADVAPGPGVDLVQPGECLSLPTGAFDVVISCECFEHNPFWLETFLNMSRMLRPGGLFMFTCAGLGRGEHGTDRSGPVEWLTATGPQENYYRNLSRRDFERRIDLKIHFSSYAFIDNRYAKDLYFIGIKHCATNDPAVADKVSAVQRAARRITIDQPLTWMRALGAHAEWWGKWSLARVLGERTYHNIRHATRPRYRRRKGGRGTS
jgi:SAM-dependent methyltransferase